jgi:hypothetical protein
MSGITMMVTVGKKKKNSIDYKIVKRAADLLFYAPLICVIIAGIIAAAYAGYWPLLIGVGWLGGSIALTLYASALKYEHDYGYTILDEDKEE